MIYYIKIAKNTYYRLLGDFSIIPSKDRPLCNDFYGYNKKKKEKKGIKIQT